MRFEERPLIVGKQRDCSPDGGRTKGVSRPSNLPTMFHNVSPNVRPGSVRLCSPHGTTAEPGHPIAVRKRPKRELILIKHKPELAAKSICFEKSEKLIPPLLSATSATCRVAKPFGPEDRKRPDTPLFTV